MRGKRKRKARSVAISFCEDHRKRGGWASHVTLVMKNSPPSARDIKTGV